MEKKICCISTNRSDYGYLNNLINKLNRSKEFKIQLIISGSHFLKDFGNTFKEIKLNKSIQYKKININFNSNSEDSIVNHVGKVLINISKVYNYFQPDYLLIAGDRFELFSFCIAALQKRIPLIHIGGGEITLNAIDDQVRHAITKMSYLHFVSNKAYKKRVIQLGENPKRVFNVGSLAVDNIKKYKLLKKNEIEKIYKFKFFKKNLIITYHPETYNLKNLDKIKELFNALIEFEKIQYIFTSPNPDFKGKKFQVIIKNFVKKHKNSIFIESMGYFNYLSTMKYIDGVVGNSSSGLTEAPSFKIGTINIGDRQTGRIKSKSIIDCRLDKISIVDSINKLYSNDFKKTLKTVKNPYDGGSATINIYKILSKLKKPKTLKKQFYDLYKKT